ncbi:MAG: CDP-alcohol phosphatidyltransferase family protein [Dehalococcoidia bacterium]|nr:CDP-alcohol phosphatidyltransferase family protein [Dehalococcoidia bacterium]
MTYDGLVSRYLNRPISRPMASGLRSTPLTPNQVTTFTLLLAIATGTMIAAGWNIAGGIAIQAVSVLDGVDGELARLKDRATRFGGVFDAVTDRYADAIMLAGMTVYAVRFEDHPRPEFVGALALGAALIVSYSRARIEADLPDVAASGNLDSVFGLASRDVRLLVAAIGTVLGQCYWTLIILAVVSGLTIAWRLLYLRITVGGRRLPPA